MHIGVDDRSRRQVAKEANNRELEEEVVVVVVDTKDILVDVDVVVVAQK